MTAARQKKARLRAAMRAVATRARQREEKSHASELLSRAAHELEQSERIQPETHTALLALPESQPRP